MIFCLKKIPIKEIIYFESEGKKVRMITEKESYEFYSKLSDVEQQLGSRDFIFIHKSFLINFSFVIEYEYESVKMSDQNVLSISQRYRKQVRDRLFQRKNNEVGI